MTKSMRLVCCSLILILGVVFTAEAEETAFVLPSGKHLLVLGVGKIYFSESSPALMLKYQTEISIDDVPALTKEADEIWSVFVKDVENAQLTAGIVSANSKPTGTIFTQTKSYNFVYMRKSDGKWSRTNP
jgi:hypothetical protein